jgi:hypothetical protein
MRNFAAHVNERANALKKGFAKEILRTIVPATPVRTGKARSNYVVGRGQRNPAIRPAAEIDPAGSISLTAGFPTIDAARPGESLHISNNLPYISRLNSGYSEQAPAGFIERAVQSAKVRLPEIKQEIKKAQSSDGR